MNAPVKHNAKDFRKTNGSGKVKRTCWQERPCFCNVCIADREQQLDVGKCRSTNYF
jgi:hypothetical protein